MGAGLGSGIRAICCLGAWWSRALSLFSLPAAEAPRLPLGHLLSCCCWQPSELQKAEMTSPGQSAGLKALPNSPVFIVPVHESQQFLSAFDSWIRC